MKPVEPEERQRLLAGDRDKLFNMLTREREENKRLKRETVEMRAHIATTVEELNTERQTHQLQAAELAETHSQCQLKDTLLAAKETQLAKLVQKEQLMRKACQKIITRYEALVSLQKQPETADTSETDKSLRLVTGECVNVKADKLRLEAELKSVRQSLVRLSADLAESRTACHQKDTLLSDMGSQLVDLTNKEMRVSCLAKKFKQVYLETKTNYDALVSADDAEKKSMRMLTEKCDAVRADKLRLETELNSVRQELAADRLAAKTQLAETERELDELKQKDMQVRILAKKWKENWLNLRAEYEELLKERSDESSATDAPMVVNSDKVDIAVVRPLNTDCKTVGTQIANFVEQQRRFSDELNTMRQEHLKISTELAQMRTECQAKDTLSSNNAFQLNKRVRFLASKRKQSSLATYKAQQLSKAMVRIKQLSKAHAQVSCDLDALKVIHEHCELSEKYAGLEAVAEKTSDRLQHENATLSMRVHQLQQMLLMQGPPTVSVQCSSSTESTSDGSSVIPIIQLQQQAALSDSAMTCAETMPPISAPELSESIKRAQQSVNMQQACSSKKRKRLEEKRMITSDDDDVDREPNSKLPTGWADVEDTFVDNDVVMNDDDGSVESQEEPNVSDR